MTIINFLILTLSTAETCTWRDGVCPNGMFCNNYGGSCITKCVDGCDYYSHMGNEICVNTTISHPFITKLIDQNCDIYNPLSYTKYTCNLDGHGIRCPVGCVEKNGKCETLNESLYLCHPTYTWQCPSACSYDKPTNSCQPMTVNSVCDLIENNNMICPSGCNYNYNLRKCSSDYPNVICDLSYKLKCPILCKLNNRGDTCIPSNTFSGLCKYSSESLCPDNCYYNSNADLCLPLGETKLFCEPYVKVECPYNEYLNDKNKIYPTCHTNYVKKVSDICQYNNVIYFPLRLENKYNSIFQCKYSDVYCHAEDNICRQNSFCNYQNYKCIKEVCPRRSKLCCNY